MIRKSHWHQFLWKFELGSSSWPPCWCETGHGLLSSQQCSCCSICSSQCRSKEGVNSWLGNDVNSVTSYWIIILIYEWKMFLVIAYILFSLTLHHGCRMYIMGMEHKKYLIEANRWVCNCQITLFFLIAFLKR